MNNRGSFFLESWVLTHPLSLNNFSTAFVASVDFADKMNSIPKCSSEFYDFRSTGMATTTELLLSKEIGQLGDSGYNSTFRTLFLTSEQETQFNSNLHKKSLSMLIQDARTKLSQTNSTTSTQNFYLVDQIESASDISDTKKKEFVLMILEDLY